MGRRKTAVALFCFWCFLIASYAANNTLQQGRPLRYWQQLESPNKRFKLGFFVPWWQQDSGSVDQSFLGIWYEDDENWSQDGEEDFPRISLPPVWVANRDDPILMGFGVLSVGSNGDLQISSAETKVIATLYSTPASINASATLQDDGNFVLQELDSDGSVKRILWQSFEHPTDTLLPGMKLGITTNLTSWKSYNSPASGSYTLHVDPNKQQLVIRKHGVEIWSSGNWRESSFDFQSFSGIDYGLNFSFFQNGSQTYFTYTYTARPNYSYFPGIRIGIGGQHYMLSGSEDYWLPSTLCSQPYNAKNYSKCIRKTLPMCRRNFKVQIFSQHYGSMSRDGFTIENSDDPTTVGCGNKCLLNCNCLAYAAINNQDNNKTGCEIWTSRAELKPASDGQGRVIYILHSEENRWLLWLTFVVGAMMILPALCSICYVIWTQSTSNGDENIKQRTLLRELEGGEASSISFGKPNSPKKDRNNELQVFSFENIVSATNYFSLANKLGEGGFGPVYKGILHDGREVAIKRLSTGSGQGVAEFKNEAVLIAKLQHTNLVRLLGFCIQVEEKILIYEYMPNKSLDHFLFDPNKKKMLNWKRRFIIIEGIAQGLLYLHKYSRLKVIHRDLKASNILLDNEMNPKISDFGMAKIVGLNESEANTNRVVGTYDYMSPEYVSQGIVSFKTDVFSFGVLLLELVSGRKNTTRCHPDLPLKLTGYAWHLWNEGRGLELMDPSVDEVCPCNQILRCIHIGLLCVQDHVEDRPTMFDIVAMLSNETILLPEPKKPGFFTTSAVQDPASVLGIESEICSINQASISVMEAR
ncbi:hypothetical protein SLA2020_361550 [Shorea laevis]